MSENREGRDRRPRAPRSPGEHSKEPRGAAPASRGNASARGAHSASGSRQGAHSAVDGTAGRAAGFFAGHSRIVAIVAIILVAALAVFCVVRISSCVRGSEQGEVSIEIAEGSSTKTIAKQLAKAGVIDSRGSFLDYVRNTGNVESLKPGTYTFQLHMNNEDVVDMLVSGPKTAAEDKLTIPEGLSVTETAEKVHEAIPSISVEEFEDLALHGAPTYAKDYPFLEGAYNDSLEGYLFPKTYEIPDDPTADGIIRMLLDQFQTETEDIDYSYAESKGLSQSDVITIASIIEEEAYIDEDRAKISSVIYNRLDQGMRLQLDSTVIYALNGSAGSHLSTDDTQVDSPYNTYVNDGLPPGPISNPGLASIEAAASPEQTDYLYYVLTSQDGSQTFCSNYDDFLAAKEKYKEVFGVQ
jgi:UPF0755 protein